MAPTYPECDELDLETTLQAVAQLDPVTISMSRSIFGLKMWDESRHGERPAVFL